jgi:hemin uptake protein HemP
MNPDTGSHPEPYTPGPVKRTPPPPDRVIPAAEIFRDRQEVCIEHHGERYRLRITRRGKLILQK